MNREQTILKHFNYAKGMAVNICLSIGIQDPWVIQDCKSEAIEALIRCVDNYDESRGASMKTYISKRLKGAVIDYFRQETGFRTRSTHKANSERFNWFNYDDIYDLANSFTYSVNGTEKTVCNKDLCSQIFKYADNINVKHNISKILQLYFFDGYTLEEVGNEIGVCDTRVSQIINATLRKIRGVFDGSAY